MPASTGSAALCWGTRPRRLPDWPAPGRRLRSTGGSETIGLTMFGVTTPCVTQAMAESRVEYDCLVFHATGGGGPGAGEARRRRHGLGCHRCHDDGSVLICNDGRRDERRRGSARRNCPAPVFRDVGSVGALDMVNFWAPETVPERDREKHLPPAQSARDLDAHHRGREIRAHRRVDRGTPQPVRWTRPLPDPREWAFRRWMRRASRSTIREADAALFAALYAAHLNETRHAAPRIRLPFHINDPAFSAALAANFRAGAA